MARKGNPQGTDNVLLDLGFDDAEELSAKAVLAVKLNKLTDTHGLSRTYEDLFAARIHGVRSELEQIRPFDATERAHLDDATAWVNSGVPLFRIAKPATPNKHLVAYFAVIDGPHILLVDHKNAQTWLPTGGHVEPGEDPRETVVRELKEELGLTVAGDQVGAPLMVTVTQTVGLTSGHTDVSLWYAVGASRAVPISFDRSEFNDVRWFHFSEALLLRSDPHLGRFLAKLRAIPQQSLLAPNTPG